MHYTEIENLLVNSSKNLTVKKSNASINDTRHSMLNKLIRQYEIMKEKADADMQEEENLLKQILDIVNSNDFSYIYSHNFNKEKVLNILYESELSVGKAKTRLQKIESELKRIKDSYQASYEKFAKDAQNSIENGIKKADAELKKEIEEYFQRIIISKEMYNELTNASII